MVSTEKNPEARVLLPSIDAELMTAEVYAKVSFDAASGPISAV